MTTILVIRVSHETGGRQSAGESRRRTLLGLAAGDREERSGRRSRHDRRQLVVVPVGTHHGTGSHLTGKPGRLERLDFLILAIVSAIGCLGEGGSPTAFGSCRLVVE